MKLASVYYTSSKSIELYNAIRSYDFAYKYCCLVMTLCLSTNGLYCRLQQCRDLSWYSPCTSIFGMALAAVPALPPHSCWGCSDMVCNSLKPCRKPKYADAASLCR